VLWTCDSKRDTLKNREIKKYMHRTFNTRTAFCAFLMLLAVLIWTPGLHADTAVPIGELVTWQGSVQLDGTAVVRGPQQTRTIHDSTVLTTDSASWAMLELHDATRLVAGPGTELKISLRTIDNYHYLDLTLERGLLRIVTGLACNRDVQDCVLNTPYGSLKLFSARADIWICEADCGVVAGQYPGLPQMSVPDGRVVHVSGQLFREEAFGIQKRLLSDDAVYLPDRLMADQDSCAVIAFNDGSVMSLRDGQRVNASDPGARRGAGSCPDWSPASGLDFRAMFATRDIGTLSHGAFARVAEGHVRLGSESDETGIGRGESGYMGNGPPVRISSWPETAVLMQTPDPAMMIRRGH
jgi:hypothetical protein